jgi:hypothetical protein
MKPLLFEGEHVNERSSHLHYATKTVLCLRENVFTVGLLTGESV